MKTIRTCNECGAEFYAAKSVPCPLTCNGTMCLVVRPKPGKRLSGTLYREKLPLPLKGAWEIGFDPHKNRYNTFLRRHWTKEQWQEQYGKLPRKGLIQTVILELPNV